MIERSIYPRSSIARCAAYCRNSPPKRFAEEFLRSAVRTEMATAPADHFATFDGLRIHWLEWGEPAAPPVLLQHGGRTSAHGTWDLTAPGFVGRHRLYGPDLRGHGESGWDPEARYTTEAFVTDMERLVDHLGLRRFHLIGHSLGGLISLLFAARHPDRVARLVIIDYAPLLGQLPPRPRRLQRPAWFASRAEAEAFVRAENPDMPPSRSLSYGFLELPDGRIGWRTDVEGLARARERADRDWLSNEAAWAAVRALEVPTLVLCAGRSGVVTAEAAKAMTTVNQRIRMLDYPNASHWLHQDEPDRFVNDVLRFLSEEGLDPMR